jgi:hypothetical protein
MNELFGSIGWTIIGVKIVALTALLFFSQLSLKEMVQGKPSQNIREQVEYSLLIITLLSTNFHIFGSYMADVIIDAEIDRVFKIQVYYLFLCILEVLYVFAIFHLHRISDCKISKICRYVIYLSLGTALCQLARYTDRVIFETDILRGYYSIAITTINVGALALIAVYPTLRLFMCLPNKKWV